MRRAKNRAARKASTRPASGSAPERLVERGIGFVDRQLDKHQPAERDNWSIGGKDRRNNN
jgi:hypothetical protein